jgi:hypothetical protein
MATTKTYTIVFLDGGSPATGLSPTIDVFKNVADGADITPIPTVSEYGNGIYAFSIDWSDSSYDGIDEFISRVDSNDGGMADADRYIYGVATRNDFLDTYQLLDGQVLGNWIIENYQLKIYTEDGTLLQTFDLTDINGDSTNLAATSRTKA